MRVRCLSPTVGTLEMTSRGIVPNEGGCDASPESRPLVVGEVVNGYDPAFLSRNCGEIRPVPHVPVYP